MPKFRAPLTSEDGALTPDGAGEVFTINAGKGATGALGGAIAITAGLGDNGASAATAPSLTLNGGGFDDSGSDAVLLAGNGDTGLPGGKTSIVGGFGDNFTDAPGEIDIYGGVGTGNGGKIDVLAGNGGTGEGGDIQITAGNGATGQVGGDVNLNSGNAGGAGTGAQVELDSGQTDGTGGAIAITSGPGATNADDGGAILIRSGAGGNNSGTGGDITIQTGGGDSAGELIVTLARDGHSGVAGQTLVSDGSGHTHWSGVAVGSGAPSGAPTTGPWYFDFTAVTGGLYFWRIDTTAWVKVANIL